MPTCSIGAKVQAPPPPQRSGWGCGAWLHPGLGPVFALGGRRELCQPGTHSLLCSGAREREGVEGSALGSREPGGWNRQGAQAPEAALGRLQSAVIHGGSSLSLHRPARSLLGRRDRLQREPSDELARPLVDTSIAWVSAEPLALSPVSRGGSPLAPSAPTAAGVGAFPALQVDIACFLT